MSEFSANDIQSLDVIPENYMLEYLQQKWNSVISVETRDQRLNSGFTVLQCWIISSGSIP